MFVLRRNGQFKVSDSTPTRGFQTKRAMTGENVIIGHLRNIILRRQSDSVFGSGYVDVSGNRNRARGAGSTVFQGRILGSCQNHSDSPD